MSHHHLIFYIMLAVFVVLCVGIGYGVYQHLHRANMPLDAVRQSLSVPVAQTPSMPVSPEVLHSLSVQ
ncbi:MAG: hypothetical protein KGI50_00825 [Patescibacteria group bacterium]|nr:hypothetical protein [Patescibacteria group bacterium]MDE2438103.1 hypothetical protein [Patescibacteria group bacterium]